MSALRELLASYRTASRTEREKGTYFELLIKDFLKNDPTYSPQFSEVWTYKDWAESQGIDSRDIGIDLVAGLSEQEGFCAIQCKFYAENYRIQKSDLDSFFTASGKKGFTRRLIIDSTNGAWSEHAETALSNQTIETLRIGLSELENSPIDWSVYAPSTIKLKPKKKPRDHQIAAIKAVKDDLAIADRGKMIMACGTGKTFTSLKIAEEIAGAGKQVLFLVPSLSLMSQTITEWTIESALPLRSYAVCSDVQVGKRKISDDLADINIHDLAYPATTNAKKLAEKIEHSHDGEMTVIFATYQSIQVISEAQKKYGLPAFDLIICDEAHRTTGATLDGEDESNFVKIHDSDYIKCAKRLYMTATPRIFGDAIKTKAQEVDAVLASMDNPALYGETLYELSFSYAVQKELLTDYKVLVLAVDETLVSEGVQKRLTDKDSELILDDATKIIGCYRALSKLDLKADVVADPNPMLRAVAFCRDIKSSKRIKDEFAAVINEYLKNQSLPEDFQPLNCEADHVDGTFNATARNSRLSWLKEDSDKNTCRILSNARCLSEGVDVPALDAILFLHPRKSQIDVVQSVGRVMRRAEGKNMGYVILPIGVPAGMSPEEALKNNEKYKVVWQILNALRSHDDRFDATINKLDLGADVSSKIEIIAVSNTLPERQGSKNEGSNIGAGGYASNDNESFEDTKDKTTLNQTSFAFDEFQKAIYAKIVKKCGKRDYWENWANDIARIAQTHVTRITALLKNKDGREYQAFAKFLEELRDDLNESITETEAIEMLAQHIITKPVFDALFEGYSFTQHNPVSQAMQSVLNVLHEQNLEKETETLQKFYDSVKMRAAGIDNAIGKQRIIVELYDKFFKNAFPKMTDRLGIVYTPVEVVDFIIHSINDALQQEFNQTLGSPNVHILDPFTGTGTFITRLLQSGLIDRQQLAYKYQNEIHANEIVLLAYYIAAINIEAAYHSIMGGDYEPFNGICLTDTFQLHEKDDLVSNMLVANSTRRKKQKALDIRVIMGNPPYSAGQKSANDVNQNIEYPKLDESIANSYAKYSQATLQRNLYDSYIRAIRWASDRIGNSGVIGFVSGNGFIEKSAMNGMRKCLSDEFTSIYVFNLRGDIRKNMLSKGKASEGHNIFGSGSMTGIAITLLIKTQCTKKEYGQIYYHDIGDNLRKDEKLAKICTFKSISGIKKVNGWQQITPDKHDDWIGQRDANFNAFISLGDKKDRNAATIFENFSLGVATNRDAWCYQFSKNKLANNMQLMIEFYNQEVERYRATCMNISNEQELKVETFINTNSQNISWSRALKNNLKRSLSGKFDDSKITQSLYRPFQKQWLYFDKNFNEMQLQMPRIFPNAIVNNRVICVSGTGARSGFSVLMMDHISSLDTIEKGQCFPVKLYEKCTVKDNSKRSENLTGELFESSQHNKSISAYTDEYTVRDGITNEGLAHFQSAYPSESINKEDVFYYIYGLLHSEDYKKRYADNLSKELPRIPCVKKTSDFWAFSQAGRDLAELHINYEAVQPYPVNYAGGELFMGDFTDADYSVEQMKFGKKGKETDKSMVIYNHKITMTHIPLDAYEYVVNGKPALEWVMERQAVTKHKESGIVNDANNWAIETMQDAAYPLKLFQRVITVSLETMKIVKHLPRLDI